MKALLLVLLLLSLPGCVEEKVPDTDGDGWDDAQEARAGTDPTKVDTDGDGLWDPLDPNPLNPEIPGTGEERAEEEREEEAQPEAPVEEAPAVHEPPQQEEPPPAQPAEEPGPSYLERVRAASPELAAEVNLGEKVKELDASQGMVAVAAEKGFYLFSFTGEQLFFYPTQAEPRHVVLSPEGVLYGATASWERRIHAVYNGSALWVHFAGDVVEELALSGDGKVLAYSSGSRVYLLNASNGTLLGSIDTGVDVATFALSGDGSYIAVAGKDGSVSLYSEKGTRLWRWEGYSFDVKVLSVAVDEEGEHVVAGTNYYRILIFSSSTPTMPVEVGTGAEVIEVFAAPDYSYFAGVSYDGKIYYFSLEGSVLLTKSYGRVYSKITFSPDGSYAAAENSIRHLYFFT